MSRFKFPREVLSPFLALLIERRDAAHYSEVVNRVNEIYGAVDVMKARAANRAA